MFTGLIQQMGRVAAIEPIAAGCSLRIDPCGWRHEPAAGDSIAVSGCCLTLVERASQWRFDVVAQTLELTRLGALRAGDPVNLEHAATPSTMLGGHLVQGHVDGVGRIEAVRGDPADWRVRIAAPDAVAAFLVDRGSIAVDGVSLTLAAVDDGWFEVALIPETLRRTTLGSLRAGDRVNLEADAIAKLVFQAVRRWGIAGAAGAVRG